MRAFLLGMCLTWISPLAVSAVDVGVGGGGACFQTVSLIQRNWMEVKRHLVPVSENLDRPADDQFVCVNPVAVRQGIESRIGVSSSLRCFRNPGSQNLGYCCDGQITSCAQLNPGLFPEHFQRSQPRQKSYEPPESNWVTPPSDGDQWKSN